MEIPRALKISNLLKKKSFFLFGARSTGKTTLYKMQLPEVKQYNLLIDTIYQKLLKNPDIIFKECEETRPTFIIIDEIQKLPILLNQVHRIIEELKIHVLMTGSSAIKIKRGSDENLLGGRAWIAKLFPLTYYELNKHNNFDLITFLNKGGLPHIYNSSEPDEELEAYIAAYITQEIRAEARTRKLSEFAHFLDVIALSSGQEINVEQLASNAQINTSTIRNYLEILEETFIAFQLKPFVKTNKRKSITRSKFYLFDVGLTRYLNNMGEIKLKSKAFGDAFEQFVILEVHAYISYKRIKRTNLTYWRSHHKQEVDLIIGNNYAIEIKSSENITKKHLKGLIALQEEEHLNFKMFVVCLSLSKYKTDEGVLIYPWQEFLNDLWNGNFI